MGKKWNSGNGPRMAEKLADLRRKLLDRIVQFSYRKKDGSLRKARGTLQQDIVPHSDHPGKKKPTSIFVYWDMDKGAFRCFRRSKFIRILKESANLPGCVFVYDIFPEMIESIIDSSEITNSRYDRIQIMKYVDAALKYGIKDYTFCGIFQDGKCRAMAILTKDRPTGCVYVAEYMAMVNGGYAEKLLFDIIAKYSRVWLTADPSADENLLQYYRRPSFQFRECYGTNEDGVEWHFFYTRPCKDYIEEFFSQEYKIDLCQKE